MGNSVIGNILSSAAPWWNTIMIIAYLIGFGLVITGLYKVAQAAQGRNATGATASGLSPVFFGSLMLALPTVMNMMTVTFFNAPAPSSALSYAPSGSEEVGDHIRFVVMVLHFVGVYAIIKALYNLSMMGEGRGGELSAAMWQLAGGAIALRIDLFMGMLGLAVGGVMQSVVGKLFSAG